MAKQQVQQVFGKHAADYAVSEVHAKGASLERMVALSGPRPEWEALDIATGAGHTAFAFAPHVRKVWATDITPEMLEQASAGAAERGLENIVCEYADAERLQYADGSFDLVSCRIAPHHFGDIPAFIGETYRVLRPGGVFALVDNVVPAGEAGAYVNAFEKLRDPSHGRCLSAAEWETGCREAGYAIEASETLRKSIPFSFWAGRHDGTMQSYLRALLFQASGEAAAFFAVETVAGELRFHLSELLLISRKPVG